MNIQSRYVHDFDFGDNHYNNHGEDFLHNDMLDMQDVEFPRGLTPGGQRAQNATSLPSSTSHSAMMPWSRGSRDTSSSAARIRRPDRLSTHGSLGHGFDDLMNEGFTSGSRSSRAPLYQDSPMENNTDSILFESDSEFFIFNIQGFLF